MYIKRIGGWGYFPDAVVYMAVLPSTAKYTKVVWWYGTKNSHVQVQSYERNSNVWPQKSQQTKLLFKATKMVKLYKGNTNVLFLLYFNKTI